MATILTQIKKDFPGLAFSPGRTFVWSAKNRTVYFDRAALKHEQGWSALLHEIGHALLGHQTYQLDLELLSMEVEAWTRARQLAGRLGLVISEDHIQGCLESYRSWIFKRSRCPNCNSTSLQQDASTYRCFACGATWQVSRSRSPQPRRMRCQLPTIIRQTKTTR